MTVTLGNRLPLLAFKVLISLQGAAHHLAFQEVRYKLRMLSSSQRLLYILHALKG